MNSEALRSAPTLIQFHSAAGICSQRSQRHSRRGLFDKIVPDCHRGGRSVSREVISAAVSKWGFRTIVTQDGHEAMAAIRAEQGPVVAILDWMMPGMDGLEVCRRVREW